jgi:putative PIN family toxin of toxin-antitoxin system
VSLRAVYDTMLFLQAAARPQRVHATIQAVRDGRVTLCLSRELLAEVADVLDRDAIRQRFSGITSEVVNAFIADLLLEGVLYDPIPRVFTLPRHPGDDHIFNLAIHARADYLLTWETRLLGLLSENSSETDMLRRLAPQLHILTPAAFARVIAS